MRKPIGRLEDLVILILTANVDRMTSFDFRPPYLSSNSHKLRIVPCIGLILASFYPLHRIKVELVCVSSAVSPGADRRCDYLSLLSCI